MIDKKKNPAIAAKTDEIDRLNEEAWLLRVTDSIRAFELSEKALRLSEETGYEKGKAEGLRTFGFCHIRLAKYDKALALLEQAYNMFLQTGDIRNQAVIHEYFGIIRRSQGDYGASLEELFKALSLSRESGFREEETLSLYHLSITCKYLGDLDNALEHALRGLPIAREIGEKMPESYHLNCIGGIYYEMGKFDEALEFYQMSLSLRQEIGDQWGVAGSLDNLGNLCFQQGKYREALAFCLQSLDITQHTGDQKGRGNTLFNTGKIFAGLHEYDEAQDYLRQSLAVRESIADKKGLAEVYCFLGSLYADAAFPQADTRQSFDHLHRGLALAEELKAKDITYKIHLQLSKSCKHASNFEQALTHYETAAAIEKEVNNEAIQQRILNLQITHRVAQSQKEAEIFRLKNVELAKLLEALNEQKGQLQQTLDHLKATQSQLIQSEKLASLGELTAGIAHEIQNPLNFVNNFAELSNELMDEMTEEMEKGNTVEAKAIASDIKQNLEKINHHGKRASNIVKGMLEHSRASSGVKEPTDLNALADEYFRLAYHGLRAKDATFNAKMETDFDETIGNVPVIPQDMGRVILNLITNAFYAVTEKKKQLAETGQAYEPTVSVRTKRANGKIILSVKDNGNGIPAGVLDKIFQPFFTTKPTGQGTGLGLSLAYDIVTKGHGGELKVETKAGGGTEFIITLNINGNQNL